MEKEKQLEAFREYLMDKEKYWNTIDNYLTSASIYFD